MTKPMENFPVAELILKAVSLLDKKPEAKWAAVKSFLFNPNEADDSLPDDRQTLLTTMTLCTLYDVIVNQKEKFPDDEILWKRLTEEIPWQRLISKGGVFFLLPVFERIIEREPAFAALEEAILIGGDVCTEEFEFFSDLIAEETPYGKAVKIPMIIRLLSGTFKKYWASGRENDALRLIHIIIRLVRKKGGDYDGLNDLISHMNNPFAQVRIIKELIDTVLETDNNFQDIVSPLVVILQCIRANHLEEQLPDFKTTVGRIESLIRHYTKGLKAPELSPQIKAISAVLLNRLAELIPDHEDIPFDINELVRIILDIEEDEEVVSPASDFITWLLNRTMNTMQMADGIAPLLNRFLKSDEQELKIMALLWPFYMAIDQPFPDSSALNKFINDSDSGGRTLDIFAQCWTRFKNPKLPDDVWQSISITLDSLSIREQGIVYSSGLLTQRNNPLRETIVAKIQEGLFHSNIRECIFWISFVLSHEGLSNQKEEPDFDSKIIMDSLIALSTKDLVFDYTGKREFFEAMLWYGFSNNLKGFKVISPYRKGLMPSNDFSTHYVEAGFDFCTREDKPEQQSLVAGLGFCGMMQFYGNHYTVDMAKKIIDSHMDSPMPEIIHSLLFEIFRKLPDGQLKNKLFQTLKEKPCSMENPFYAVDVLKALSIFAARSKDAEAESLLRDYFNVLRESGRGCLYSELREMDSVRSVCDQTIIITGLTAIFEHLWETAAPPYFDNEYMHLGMIAMVIKKMGDTSFYERLLERLHHEMKKLDPSDYDFALETIGQCLLIMEKPDMIWGFLQKLVEPSSEDNFYVIIAMISLLREMPWDSSRWSYVKELATGYDSGDEDGRMMRKLHVALKADLKDTFCSPDMIPFVIEMGQLLVDNNQYKELAHFELPLLARYPEIPEARKSLKAFTEEIFEHGDLSHQLKASESLIKAGFTSEATTRLKRLETQIENIEDARNAAAGLVQIAYITKKLPDYIPPVEKILSISRNIKSTRERDNILIDLLPELRDPVHAQAKKQVISQIPLRESRMTIVEEIVEDFIIFGDFGKVETLLPDLVKKEMFHPHDLLKFVGDGKDLEWLADKVLLFEA